ALLRYYPVWRGTVARRSRQHAPLHGIGPNSNPHPVSRRFDQRFVLLSWFIHLQHSGRLRSPFGYQKFCASRAICLRLRQNSRLTEATTPSNRATPSDTAHSDLRNFKIASFSVRLLRFSL